MPNKNYFIIRIASIMTLVFSCAQVASGGVVFESRIRAKSAGENETVQRALASAMGMDTLLNILDVINRNPSERGAVKKLYDVIDTHPENIPEEFCLEVVKFFTHRNAGDGILAHGLFKRILILNPGAISKNVALALADYAMNQNFSSDKLLWALEILQETLVKNPAAISLDIARRAAPIVRDYSATKEKRSVAVQLIGLAVAANPTIVEDENGSSLTSGDIDLLLENLLFYSSDTGKSLVVDEKELVINALAIEKKLIMRTSDELGGIKIVTMENYRLFYDALEKRSIDVSWTEACERLKISARSTIFVAKPLNNDTTYDKLLGSLIRASYDTLGYEVGLYYLPSNPVKTILKDNLVFSTTSDGQVLLREVLGSGVWVGYDAVQKLKESGLIGGDGLVVVIKGDLGGVLSSSFPRRLCCVYLHTHPQGDTYSSPGDWYASARFERVNIFIEVPNTVNLNLAAASTALTFMPEILSPPHSHPAERDL